MSSVIEIENLTKDYEVGFWRKRRVRALDNLSLAVAQGEVFGFLGANGAGKTTTLKLLMRLIYPTAGCARILGRDISDVAMHRRIGYLPEQPYFYDYLSARELVEYYAELFGYKRGARRQRAAQLLQRVGLEETAWDKQLRRFSKGMLQRVGLAQALVNNPEVVFLDEPMSGLDPLGRREVRDLITSMRAQGTTVFLCSHILSDIEVLCDRVGIMRHGRLAHLGTFAELRDDVDGATSSNHRIEIIVANCGAASVEQTLTSLVPPAKVAATPSGVRIELTNQHDVVEVLAAVRRCGAQLISVHPLGSSLEDLFVRETSEQTSNL